jgi:hypothetical protein
MKILRYTEHLKKNALFYSYTLKTETQIPIADMLE